MSKQVFEYRVRWEQNMGGGRGITMEITTNHWETAQHVWRKCCKNRFEDEVRDVKVTCDGKEFAPEGPWPRPSAFLMEDLPPVEAVSA